MQGVCNKEMAARQGGHRALATRLYFDSAGAGASADFLGLKPSLGSIFSITLL